MVERDAQNAKLADKKKLLHDKDIDLSEII